MTVIRRSSWIVVLLLLFGSTGAEGASVLTTSAVWSLDTFFGCFAVNVGTRDMEVASEIVDMGGSTHSSRSDTLLPGEGRTLFSGSTGVIGYCRFTVTKGNKANLRGSYCVLGPDTRARQATGEAR